MRKRAAFNRSPLQFGGKMENLYLIVGRSAAGKDTVTNLVAKKTGLLKVVSCTDAKIRSDQRNGREHWFLTPAEMDHLLESEQILAYTKIGDHRYCVPSRYVGGKTRLYIIDPEGVQSLSSDRFRLVPFYISVPEEIRKKRALARKGFDMEKRLAAEDAEFSVHERKGAYIEIDNSREDPNIAAEKIADTIHLIERGERLFTKRGESVISDYLETLRVKRDEILAARENTADGSPVPPEDNILSGITLRPGIDGRWLNGHSLALAAGRRITDETSLPTKGDILSGITLYPDIDGKRINCWEITGYNGLTPLRLTQGVDYV